MNIPHKFQPNEIVAAWGLSLQVLIVDPETKDMLCLITDVNHAFESKVRPGQLGREAAPGQQAQRVRRVLKARLEFKVQQALKAHRATKAQLGHRAFRAYKAYRANKVFKAQQVLRGPLA